MNEEKSVSFPPDQSPREILTDLFDGRGKYYLLRTCRCPEKSGKLLPWERACEVLYDLLGVRMSQGMLASLIVRCAKQLEPIEVLIKEALKTAEVLHQDESGCYVAGQHQWVHVYGTLFNGRGFLRIIEPVKRLYRLVFRRTKSLIGWNDSQIDS